MNTCSWCKIVGTWLTSHFNNLNITHSKRNSNIHTNFTFENVCTAHLVKETNMHAHTKHSITFKAHTFPCIVLKIILHKFSSLLLLSKSYHYTKLSQMQCWKWNKVQQWFCLTENKMSAKVNGCFCHSKFEQENLQWFRMLCNSKSVSVGHNKAIFIWKHNSPTDCQWHKVATVQ